MEGGVENRSKMKLSIDWDKVLPDRSDDAPAELIVPKSDPQPPARKSVPMSVIRDDSGSGDEFERSIPDHLFRTNIACIKNTYEKLHHILPDKGEKLLATIARLEKERKRRRLARAKTILESRGDWWKPKSRRRINCMEGGVENHSKMKLSIDRDKVLPDRSDDAPAELIVPKGDPPPPARKSVPMSVIRDDSGSGDEFEWRIPDHWLRTKIACIKNTYEKLHHILPDKGEKLLATIARLEKERKRRRLARAKTVCLA